MGGARSERGYEVGESFPVEAPPQPRLDLRRPLSGWACLAYAFAIVAGPGALLRIGLPLLGFEPPWAALASGGQGLGIGAIAALLEPGGQGCDVPLAIAVQAVLVLGVADHLTTRADTAQEWRRGLLLSAALLGYNLGVWRLCLTLSGG